MGSGRMPEEAKILFVVIEQNIYINAQISWSTEIAQKEDD